MKGRSSKNQVKQIFNINEYLQVKLEGKETVIYVGGKCFIICKRLIMDIPIVDIPEIDSIDEVADQVEDPLLHERVPKKYKITPEEEFKAHCSNLQIWAESGYDTCLLHRNLAFPLLRRLAGAGDPLAIHAFKEEIRERMESLYGPVQEYLVMEGYLHLFSKSERLELMQLVLDPKKLKKIASRLISSREYQQAIELYQSILDANPLDKDALTQLAFLYFQEGEYMKSLDSYLHGLELHGELYSENYLMIGENYEALGHYEKAKKIYQYISCNHTCGRDEALLSLGRIYQLEGNKAKAKRILWKIIKTDFSNGRAWYQLFRIFRDEEDFAHAIITLKEAYRYVPFSFVYLEELKDVYKKLHDNWHYFLTVAKLGWDKIKLKRYKGLDIIYLNDKLVFRGKEFGKFRVLYRLDIQETEKRLFNPVRIFIQDNYRKERFIKSQINILDTSWSD